MGGMIFVLGVGGGLLYAGSAAGVGGGVGGVVLGGRVYGFGGVVGVVGPADTCLVAPRGVVAVGGGWVVVSHGVSPVVGPFVGGGGVGLVGGGFVGVVLGSFVGLVGFWRLFGGVSVFVAGVVVGLALLYGSPSRRRFRVFWDQGVGVRVFLGGFLVCATVFLGLAVALSLMFSDVLESVGVGVVDYVLGYTPLYSTLSFGLLVLVLLFGLLGFLGVVSAGLVYVFGVGGSAPRVGGRRRGWFSTVPVPLGLGVVGLVLVVFAVGFLGSAPFYGVVSYALDLGYVGAPHGVTLVPPGSPVPLTAGLVAPVNLSACPLVSGEVAYPALVGGVRTLVRGVVVANATGFVDYSLRSGSWPSSPFEVALGSGLAARLGVGAVGSNVSVVDLLSGASFTARVTGVYSAPGVYG
ncbi:MAG: hypothetical protein QW613_08060, partial [Thermoprotei archaeon]